MQPLLLQDLVTIRGAAGQQIVQSATSWLDLGELEDITIFTDVREVSAGVTMKIETAAVAHDAAFVQLVPSFTLATGLRTDVIPASLANVPPARFIRWNLSVAPGATGDATFRIWIAGYGWA